MLLERLKADVRASKFPKQRTPPGVGEWGDAGSDDYESEPEAERHDSPGPRIPPPPRTLEPQKPREWADLRRLLAVSEGGAPRPDSRGNRIRSASMRHASARSKSQGS